MEVNPIRGRRPVLQNCTIAELAVDPAYQRSIDNGASQAFIRAIARDWDWRLCQPLVVAQRGEGELFVIDGQHRLAAARLRRDIYDLPCIITNHDGAGEEADAFVALNQKRKALSALDLFKASVASGDDKAAAVHALIDAAGLSLAAHTNFRFWRPGQISNIGGILRCYRAHGAALTGMALRVLARSFPGQVLRYGGTLFSGVWPVLGALGGAADEDLLVIILSAQEQADWIREIAAYEAQQGIHRARAAAWVLRAAYDDVLAEEAAA